MDEDQKSGIGQLNEKALHAALKEWYARPGDRFEVPLDGYVIDIVRDDLLLEIQTGNFTAIRRKLKKLLDHHPLRLIYPIAREKWIIKLEEDGQAQISRRKSPKRGRVEDLFYQMVSFPRLLDHPNFSLEVLLIREEELRRKSHNGHRNWRRKGWGIIERRLLEVVECRLFTSPADWRTLLPANLSEFTSKDLAEAGGLSRPLAQKICYCLRKAEIITSAGKQGRAILYHIKHSER